MRHLYSALLYCLLPLALARLLWRSRRAPDYRRRLGERFGFYPQPAPGGSPVIWVHAASVGEVAAVARLVERLLSDYPGGNVVVTTTTPTGSQRVNALFGDRVSHVYCPWDLPGAVRRFLRWAQPDVLVLVETELWPNLLRLCRASGCRTVLVNGRLSQRSARRYARLAGFSRWLVGQLDAAVCQGDADSKRFLSLGVPRDRLSVSGNLKWDAVLDEWTLQQGERLRAQFGNTRTLLAASTHPGEEQAVLTAYADVVRVIPGCALVLAPRHPERADEVAALCVGQGLQWVRLSDGVPGALGSPGGPAVLLVDTVGDLASLYAVATVAFIGGSLVRMGGHNPLEAALWEVPVVSGPHVRNFEAVFGVLTAAGAAEVVRSGGEVAAACLLLLQDPARRARMSGAARAAIEANRGALERTLAVVSAQLEASQFPAAVGGGGSSR